MSEPRTRTGPASLTTWSKRIGLATGVLALLGTLGGGALWTLDARYATAQGAADLVRRDELPEVMTKAVEEAIRPLREEQARMQAKVDEIRCLLLGGRFVLGSCMGAPGPG